MVMTTVTTVKQKGLSDEMIGGLTDAFKSLEPEDLKTVNKYMLKVIDNLHQLSLQEYQKRQSLTVMTKLFKRRKVMDAIEGAMPAYVIALQLSEKKLADRFSIDRALLNSISHSHK